MDLSTVYLDSGFDPVFIFRLQTDGTISCLVDLNEPALTLMDSTRENIFLLKDQPAEWFPFLSAFTFNKETLLKTQLGKIYTDKDDSVDVEIKPFVITNEKESLLVLTVREVLENHFSDPEFIHYGNIGSISGGGRYPKLFQALNTAAEKMEKEITPEGVFNAVKNQFKKLGFSCSIYLTTPDLKFIYAKYLSYSPFIIKMAEKLFGIKPFDFMIPVDDVSFARKLVHKRETLYAERANDELAEMFEAFPAFSSVSERIIKWMSRFLKRTISSPLVIDNRVIGALTVHSNNLHDKDRTAIKAFAHQVATALHKAKLLEDLQKNLDEKDRAEKALRVSETRLKLAFEATNDAIWDYSLQTDQLYLGPRWSAILGFSKGELKPELETIMKLVHPDDQKFVTATYKRCLHDPTRKFVVDFRIKNKAGEWLHMRSKATFVNHQTDDKPTRFVGISSEITEQKNAEEQIIRMAFHDGLTGLMNRKAFVEKSDALLLSLKRREDTALTAYCYLDLDHFEDVNYTFGHNVGDECLKLAGQRLKENTRESDLLFRLDGDEFFLILTDLKKPTDASLVADKLVKAFLKPFYWKEQPVYLNLSVGISLFPRDGKQTWQLLSNADTALYKAKKERSTFRFYDEALQIEAIKKITIVNDIRNALESDEFQMYYQPIFTCDGKLASAEALIRWFGPDGNPISPASFIPWAEESGLIIPIGFNVLKMVVDDMAEWKSEGMPTFPVSINIAAKQLKQQELVPTMTKLLQSNSLDPALFHLEITEHSLMENLSEVLDKLDVLKKSRLAFSLDNFGTGYSSLNDLVKLPVATLKIDRSFVAGLPAQQDAVLVKAIISLARQLNLNVTAEGVETQSQYEFLKANGAPLIQGYYFSAPLPKQKFVELIRQNS